MSERAADTEWLIDKSALVRLGASDESQAWAERIQRGLVRIATVTLLEIGCSARDARDLEAGLHGAPVGSMPVQYATPVAEDRGPRPASACRPRTPSRPLGPRPHHRRHRRERRAGRPAPGQGLRPHTQVTGQAVQRLID